MEFAEKLARSPGNGTLSSDLRLYCCGHRFSAPEHFFPPSTRDHYWIIFLRAGTGILETDGRRHRLAPGMFFAAFPNLLIHYRADPGSVWSHHWISVDGDFAARAFARIGITPETPVGYVTDPLSAVAAFEELFGIFGEETVASEMNRLSLVCRIFSLIARGDLCAGGERDAVGEALAIMTTQCEKQLTVAEIAEAVRLSPAYFNKLFARRMGCSPNRWRTLYRLDRACGLLKSTDLRVGEVAYSVGFGDPLYFSRCFARRYGCSPTEWRARGGSNGSDGSDGSDGPDGKEKEREKGEEEKEPRIP